jgi:hypothetical protein
MRLALAVTQFRPGGLGVLLEFPKGVEVIPARMTQQHLALEATRWGRLLLALFAGRERGSRRPPAVRSDPPERGHESKVLRQLFARCERCFGAATRTFQEIRRGGAELTQTRFTKRMSAGSQDAGNVRGSIEFRETDATRGDNVDRFRRCHQSIDRQSTEEVIKSNSIWSFFKMVNENSLTHSLTHSQTM